MTEFVKVKVKQPSAKPNRKIMATIIAGVIVKVAQIVFEMMFPDAGLPEMVAQFEPLLGDLLAPVVMVAAGWLTHDVQMVPA